MTHPTQGAHSPNYAFLADEILSRHYPLAADDDAEISLPRHKLKAQLIEAASIASQAPGPRIDMGYLFLEKQMTLTFHGIPVDGIDEIRVLAQSLVDRAKGAAL